MEFSKAEDSRFAAEKPRAAAHFAEGTTPRTVIDCSMRRARLSD
jgi:hypothetical protein